MRLVEELGMVLLEQLTGYHSGCLGKKLWLIRERICLLKLRPRLLVGLLHAIFHFMKMLGV